MIYRQAVEKDCFSIIKPLLLCLIGIAMVILCTAFPALGANDLLLMPAEKSDRAAFSILMDVVKVDSRLVAVGERGHILYSEDACTSWVQAQVPVSVNLTAVCFPTYEKGWAVGHDGVVLNTEDGGKTWKKQLDGTKINELVYNQIKQMIQTKSELIEDEAAGLSEAEREDLEIEVEDLGYFLSDAELAVEEGPTRPLMDVWFKNDKEGIIIGSFGMILGTSDGGNTWQPLLDRIDNVDGFHYYGIIRSGDDLFIAGEAGGLYRSEDFGRTWQRLESPYEGSYFGIIGNLSGDFVMAFGLRGHIYYSLDRGETWQPTSTGKKASLSGGAFLSGGILCVVGVDGSIFKSTDKGKTFTLLPKRFPGAIAVAEVKKGVVSVVGIRGATQVDLNPSSSEK